MRKFIIPLLMCLFAFELVAAQTENDTTLFRSDRPIAGKIGFEGLGIDVAIGSVVALEATSFLVYNTAKARVLLLKKNATPFLGIGVGGASSFSGGSRSWTVLFVGWEQDYERIFFEFILQSTIQKFNSYDRSVFPINFEMGLRF